ncbi:MAG: hypothetical protein AAGE01_20960 [Pseudomonadota bacterium]
MESIAQTLFYLAFAGQILLLSWLLPRGIVQRMRAVMSQYPPEDYPRLYPSSPEIYVAVRWIYGVANHAILGLGVVLLVLLVFVVDHATFADDGYISEAWPAAYAFLQYLPLMALSALEFRQFGRMRALAPQTRRSASLERRTVFDFLSPNAVVIALCLAAAAFVMMLAVDELDGAIWFLVGTGFMAAMGYWHLYGRKPNPHQSAEDRRQEQDVALHSALYVSIVLSLFYMYIGADQLFDLDWLDALVMSLYFQLIGLLSVWLMLHRLRIEDVDFSVYRDGPEASAS